MDKERLNTNKEFKAERNLIKGDLLEEYKEIQEQEYLNALKVQRKPIMRIIIDAIRNLVT